jgi:hypothetical protein
MVNLANEILDVPRSESWKLSNPLKVVPYTDMAILRVKDEHGKYTN